MKGVSLVCAGLVLAQVLVGCESFSQVKRKSIVAPTVNIEAKSEPTNAPAAKAVTFGYVPSRPDQLAQVPFALPPLRGDLPRKVDWASKAPSPGQQGLQPSCVGWAVAYGLKSYQEAVERDDQAQPSKPSELFSPSFVYNQVRFPGGGASLVEALGLILQKGAATLEDMDYEPRDDRRKPDEATTLRAAKYRIEFWRRVNPSNGNEIKAHLAAGFPILIGAKVDNNFQELAPGAVWKRFGRFAGDHAMLVIGYDDAKEAFKVLNSWSTLWGDGGYGWIDYSLFQTVVSEAYIAKDATNGTPSPSRPNNDHGKVDTGSRPRDLAFTIAQSFPERWGDRLESFTVRGTWQVPVGLGHEVQLAVYVEQMKGQSDEPIGRFRSLDTEFADAAGFVVFASSVYPVPTKGRRAGNWEITINPKTVAWPISGTGEYIYRARIVMFVDGFGFDQDGRPFTK